MNNITFLQNCCNLADGFKMSENNDCIICHNGKVFYFDGSGEISLEEWEYEYFPYLIYLAYQKSGIGKMLGHVDRVNKLKNIFKENF